jgi:hypothetical protein
VEQLTVLPEERSAVSHPEKEDWPKIRLEWTTDQLDNGRCIQSGTFDAVMICNGHYSLPASPVVPGLEEYFRGTVLHSVAYDRPEEYAGKTVLCVGGRASGSDIAREIAAQPGTMVYLSDTKVVEVEMHHNVTLVPKTVQVLSDGSLQFDHDCELHPVVDTIIFCSGYDYHFPFINDKSNLELTARDRRVQPLYEQLWHAVYPNLAFVGLPHSILPFPLFELQAEAVSKQWQHCTLPDLDDRLTAAAAASESGGEGKEAGRVPEDTHYLGGAQWDYCRRMAAYAGIYDETMENYIATNKVS